MKIALVGNSGKMGCALQEQMKQIPPLHFVGGVRSIDSFEKFFSVFEQADLVIDFSLPSSLPFVLDSACQLQKPLVMGTSGYTKKDMKKIELASKKIPIFYSTNFSLGIFLLNKMLEKLSDELTFFDSIDLLEWHQKEKKDAPSATSLMFIETIRSKTNIPLHIQSIRSGSIFREHSIYFTGASERVTLKHVAYDRSVYAKGALQAAFFLQGKNPGLYNMEHLLQDLCKK